MQGDARLDDRRVTVSLEPGASADASRVRVRTTVAVEEPVVTVTLRAGCEASSSRRFVLLADLPVDTPAVGAPVASSGQDSPGAAAAAASAARPLTRGRDGATGGQQGDGEGAVAPRRSAPARVARAPAGQTAARASAPAPRPRPAPAPRVTQVPAAAPVAPAPSAAPPAPAPVAPAAEAARSSGGRLQIDALEPTVRRDGELRSSSTLTLPGAEDAAKRAEAAAAWRAIATTPEETAREQQRLQALEATLNALRDQTAQNERMLATLRTELAEARESRFNNPLVYALLAILLLMLLALAMMWRALRRATTAPAWWGPEGTAPAAAGASSRRRAARPDDEDDEDDEGEDERRGGARWGLSPALGAGAGGAATAAGVAAAGAAVVAPLMPVAAHHPRVVNTEELFDVQQQSDFFLSLGQHDQAIGVLRDHIAANPGTSALAYLDLFKIYHSLGRKDEYDRLRSDFLRAFNAGVPEFERFEEAGRGLEHYRDTLERIEAQWPSSTTLPLIEELVFRKPGHREDESFDLAAYRELLLLYAVAKEIIDPDAAPPAPATPLSYADTNVHGLDSTLRAPLTTDPMPLATDALPLEMETAPAPLDDGPVTQPPSLYGALDHRLHDDTVMAPDAPLGVPPEIQRPQGEAIDLAQFDRTAYETLPTPLAPVATPPAATDPQPDPHTIDFELFDPETEAEIAPRRPPKA